ncbi:MAG TPA: hypothetical protein VFV87_19180 [Pirellulaceae bacterium]|nr:hypothetical protein [Pirellulaceae bacterium]
MARAAVPLCLALLAACSPGYAQQNVIDDFGYAPQTGLTPASPQPYCLCGEDGLGMPPCRQWWCSSWYVRAEALFLLRTNGFQDQVLVENNAGAGLLSTNDLSFDLEPGVSALLGHRIDNVSAWELSYFGALQWQSKLQAASLANLDLPDPLGAELDDFDNADLISIAFASTLHNVEVNYLRDFACFSALVGFRYLSWEEQLGLQALDGDGDISNYDVGTSNNLFGAQLGARTVLHAQWVDWECTGRAGIFGNDAQQRQLLTDDDNAISVRNTGSRARGAAFVGDINLSAHCRLSRVWSLRAGYGGLWITGLALAPDQLDFSNNLTSGTALAQNGSAFVHGLNVGLEALW